MKGFFYNPTPKKVVATTKATRGTRPTGVPRVRGPLGVPSLPVCASCKLFAGCKSPKIPVTGGGQRSILFISDSPGESEDADGLHLVGRSGQLLEKRLGLMGVDLDRDCWTIGAINCRTPKGREPTKREVEYCRPSVMNAIKQHRPHVIVPLGKIALESLLEHRWPKALGGVAPWRGWQIPDRVHRAWIVPTYSPSMVLWGDENDALDLQFCGDLETAIECLEKEVPTFTPEETCIRILNTPGEACDYIDRLLFDEPELCAFDYETTGLKPYHPKHRVVCASLAPNGEEAVAFMFPKEPHKDLTQLWKKFLGSPIGKIASNMKFEHVWSTVKMGVEPVNWQWDTMLGAHVLDNRPNITSIKFQGYVHTGLIGYDETVAPYLKASDKDEAEFGGNAFNRVEEAPQGDLLKYCAIDSLLEYRVAEIQMRLM